MNELLRQSQNSIQSSDPAIVAAAETSKQRIQAAYLVAINKPRDIESVRTNALKLCSIAKFAEQFVSYKPIGKTRVAVDSIRAMEGLASVYGNIQTDYQVTYDDENTHREKCFVTDLETNMTYSDEFTLKKTVERKTKIDREVVGERTNTRGEIVYIVKATEDEMLVKINAMKSKVMRNLLHRVIQPWLIEECRERAQETIRNGIKSNPESEKRKIIDAFSEIGVATSDLAKYIGHPLSAITQAEIFDLRKVYSSVKSGDASFWEFLKNKTESENEEKTSKFENVLQEAKVDCLPESEKKSPAQKTDLEKLADLISEKGIPVTAEQVKDYVEKQGEIFSFDMIKDMIGDIAEAIVMQEGK